MRSTSGDRRQAREETSFDEVLDEELVARIRDGHLDGLDLLYDRYFPRVYRFALKRVRRPIDAEDLAQETFVALLESLPSYQGRSAFISWILGVARNVIQGHLRRDQRREVLEGRREARDPEPDPPTPEQELLARRAVGALRGYLRRVAVWERDAAVLRFGSRLPIREIARRTGRSRYAVRTSLARMEQLVTREVAGERPRDTSAPRPAATALAAERRGG